MKSFKLGDRVETIKPQVESSDWRPEAKLLRRWGVTGFIVDKHDSHGPVYEVKHEDDKTTACYEPRELKTVDPFTYTPDERAAMLQKMRHASDVFYSLSAASGCHALIEYTGLMNEFIKVCAEAHAAGDQFPFANTHSGETLPFKPYHLAYLAEKLNCIYGPSLLSGAENRDAFIQELFDGAFKLVPVEQREVDPTDPDEMDA